MDGVFINLTDCDITLPNSIIIKHDPELITGSRNTSIKESKLKAITHNDEFEKITDVSVYSYSEYIKYPFTQDQIDKINNITKGRKRLLILSQKDVEYWSNGKFQCPFRQYRLFTFKNGNLIEYPIPKTYLDIVTETVNSTLIASKKFYNSLNYDE